MGKNCPCCERHCDQSSLQCPRGEAHFGMSREDHPEGREENVIILLRKCGHFLHHNAGHDADVSRLENVLTEEEKSVLKTLLKKCLNGWEKDL